MQLQFWKLNDTMFYYHSLSNSNQQAVLISYGLFVVSFYFILFSTFLFKFYSNQFSSSFNFLIKFFYFCFSLKQGLYYGIQYFIEERYKLKFSIIQVSFFHWFLQFLLFHLYHETSLYLYESLYLNNCSYVVLYCLDYLILILQDVM